MARSHPDTPPFSLPACFSLWLSLWQAPRRALLGSALSDPFACFDGLPHWPVLRAFGPLWLQRRVVAAVLARQAAEQPLGWYIDWPNHILMMSIGWDGLAHDGIALETRLEMSEDFIRRLMDFQLEVLLRVLSGRGPYSQALALRVVAGCCWRLALLYGELCRRHKSAQARRIVEEELRRFLGPLAAERPTG